MASEARLEVALSRPWLSIVGIGEDGIAGLGENAQRRILDAEFVFGGKRHLALAAPLIKGKHQSWPSPFDTALSELIALRGRRVCVLASGDPVHDRGACRRRLPRDDDSNEPAERGEGDAVDRAENDERGRRGQMRILTGDREKDGCRHAEDQVADEDRGDAAHFVRESLPKTQPGKAE